MARTAPQQADGCTESVIVEMLASFAASTDVDGDQVADGVDPIHRYLQKELYSKVVRPVIVGFASQDEETAVVVECQTIINRLDWYIGNYQFPDDEAVSEVPQSECSISTEAELVDELADQVNRGLVNPMAVARDARRIENQEVVFDEIIRPLIVGLAAQGTDRRNRNAVKKCRKTVARMGWDTDEYSVNVPETVDTVGGGE